ncbi:MAG: histidine kinase dimerization/phospho-acceptor domain-containing protein [Candidatus Nitrosopolaris sp.]
MTECKRNSLTGSTTINITAHELRTPVQSLLVLTEVLHSMVKDIEEHKLLDSTIKNAKRLQRLSNDILDVTRIESQSLELNKKQFGSNDRHEKPNCK